MYNTKTANCTNCNKPILNEGQFFSFLQFSMRCPWCQSTLHIAVQPKIIVQSVINVRKEATNMVTALTLTFTVMAKIMGLIVNI